MAALNRVQLIGRLGRDPEGRYTPNGKKVAHFSLAVSNRWKSREGEMNESTEWVNIEVWDRLGEVCQEFLKKGSLVYLEGRLKTDKYEENGESRFFTKVVASTIEFLDGKSADDPMVRKQDEIEDEVVEYQL
jgi:single-strand DNA-binding protein